MGALEYEPDSYLVKPFTKEMVHQRLLKAVAKKQELIDVYEAIQHDDLNKAIDLCDDKINAGGNLALSCLKLKGKLLIKTKRYEEAFKLYDELLSAKKLPWVLMAAWTM